MKISNRLLRAFSVFLELVPAKRLNKNTHSVLLTYLQHELDGGLFNFMTDHVRDLEQLFTLLEVIEAECDQSELLKADPEKDDNDDE